MDDATALNSEAPVVRMGIRGIPDLSSSMLSGGLYVLIAKTTSARFPLLASSIASGLNGGITSAVIVSANPAQFLQRIEMLADIDVAALVETQRLQLFMLQDNFLKKMFQFGADRFVSELEDFGIPQHSYLIFDQADELLSLHDVSLAHEQATVLKEWFARKGITALLVFSRLTDAHGGTINAIMDSLDGVARLGSEKDGLALSFDYWQSPTSVTVAKNYHLVSLDTGLYEAVVHSAVLNPIVREASFLPQLLERPLPNEEMAPFVNSRAVAAKLEKYRGYLKPLSFLQEVERILEQSPAGATSCTLVVGVPAQGLEVSEIVKRYDRSARVGELISADERHCYICLNTGSQSLALENLQVILGLPVSAAFNQSVVLNDHDEIRLNLAGLLHAARHSTYPEFSSIHDVAQPLRPSSSVGEKSSYQFSSPLRNTSALRTAFSSQGDESLGNASNALLLDFEPARRSSTPYAKIFEKSEPMDVSSVHVTSHANSAEDIIFDAEENLHGLVFGKTDAPRAKRSLN